MSKAAKICIIAAAVAFVGILTFCGAMTALKWNFTELTVGSFVTNTYGLGESFGNITILTDTADIELLPSQSGKNEVVCRELENEKHTVSVKDGTLIIENNDQKKWYEHIGINIGEPKVSVYLAETEYAALTVKESTGDVEIPSIFRFDSIDILLSTGDVELQASASGAVKIKTSTGDIEIENLSAGEVSLAVTTGEVEVSRVRCEGAFSLEVTTGKAVLSDITCKAFFSNGDTGRLTLKKVIVTELLSLVRSTGDIKLEECDAGELLVVTDTGDVRGSLLSEKVFIVRSDTGKIDVPKTATGGRCDITTDTGDIIITVK